MNCKQGDLALITCGPARGQTVTCLEALPAGFRRDGLPAHIEQRIGAEEGSLWRIDRSIEWGDLLYLPIVPDAVLMPIGRKSPDAGEMRREHHTAESC